MSREHLIKEALAHLQGLTADEILLVTFGGARHLSHQLQGCPANLPI